MNVRANLKSFTLIEILIVLTLLGVLAAFSVPNFSNSYSNLLLKKSVDDLAYCLRYAQSRAVLKGTTVRFHCNAPEKNYWLEDQSDAPGGSISSPNFQRILGRFGRTYVLPGDAELNCEQEFILFFPTGDIEKTRIEVSMKEKTWTVSTKDQRNHVKVFAE